MKSQKQQDREDHAKKTIARFFPQTKKKPTDNDQDIVRAIIRARMEAIERIAEDRRFDEEIREVWD